MEIYYTVVYGKHGTERSVSRVKPENITPLSLEQAREAVEALGGSSSCPALVFATSTHRVVELLEAAGEKTEVEDLFEETFLGACFWDDETRLAYTR
jgi:hypothetical protein